MINNTPYNPAVNPPTPPRPPDIYTPTGLNKIYILAIIIFSIIIICSFYFFVVSNDTIAVNDQVLGKTILISKLTIHQSGIVSIRLPNKYNKISENSIGQSRLLSPDTYKDISVNLYPHQPTFKSGDILFAVVLDSNYVKGKNLTVLKDFFGRELKTQFTLK